MTRKLVVTEWHIDTDDGAWQCEIGVVQNYRQWHVQSYGKKKKTDPAGVLDSNSFD